MRSSNMNSTSASINSAKTVAIVTSPFLPVLAQLATFWSDFSKGNNLNSVVK